MNKQLLRSKKDHKAFCTVTFSCMCILTFFCTVIVLKNDIFRDHFVALVCITNLLILVFLTVMTGVLCLRKKELNRTAFFFLLFLLALYITIFFSALADSLYRIPGHAAALTLLETLCYFFTMMIFPTLWLYQKQFLRPTAVTRVVTVLISAFLLVYAALLIVNLSHPLLFHITEGGVASENVTDHISVIFALFCIALLCLATFSSDLSRSRKFSFLCCIFTPILFGTLSLNQTILSQGIYLWGVICIAVLLPLSLIFFNAHDELEKDVLRHEKEQTQLRISAMISQMQPHFLYNSLAVIAALCEEDPKLAAKATNAFSDYLRENMNFADKSSPIPFSEELNHIKTYVWLEKLRFPNKLNVEYEIRCTGFSVPALSVQPMVENAIKHGICKSRSGGTVRICSLEADSFYCVTVSDDGIGFDPDQTIDDGKQHLGIKNTRYRIREMMGGGLDMESAPGKGTTVTIKIPK